MQTCGHGTMRQGAGAADTQPRARASTAPRGPSAGRALALDAAAAPAVVGDETGVPTGATGATGAAAVEITAAASNAGVAVASGSATTRRGGRAVAAPAATAASPGEAAARSAAAAGRRAASNTMPRLLSTRSGASAACPAMTRKVGDGTRPAESAGPIAAPLPPPPTLRRSRGWPSGAAARTGAPTASPAPPVSSSTTGMRGGRFRRERPQVPPPLEALLPSAPSMTGTRGDAERPSAAAAPAGEAALPGGVDGREPPAAPPLTEPPLPVRCGDDGRRAGGAGAASLGPQIGVRRALVSDARAGGCGCDSGGRLAPQSP